jgi:hypothetical protein
MGGGEISIGLRRITLWPFSPYTIGRGSHCDANADHGPIAITTASPSIRSPSTKTPETRLPSALRASPVTHPARSRAPLR